MLLILALFLLPSHNTHALPTPTDDPYIISSSNSTPCSDLHRCRTGWNIVSSCLVVVFSCIWTSLHLNIPSPEDAWLTRKKRRVGVMLLALIAPEAITLWAIRQHLMAREIAKEFKAYGWTQTHGFFAIMGGFILVDVVKVEGRREFKEIHTLLPRACFSSHFYESDTLPRVLESLPEEDFPIVTEKRIKDMSKGDLLSKGFALWQTAWFVLQIIARAIERLPITELEITTLAYAVLNVITYALWWNKPLGVEQPFPVLRRIPPISASTKSEELQSELKPSDEPSSSAPKTLDPMRDEKEDLAETDPGDSIGSAPYSETSSLALINPQHSPDEPSLSHPRSVAESVRRGWSYLSSFPEPIWDFVTSIFDAISTFLDGDIELQEGDKRVPTFYRGVTGSGGVEDPAFWTGFIITTIFGAIHCIAWSFHFPTHAEQLIWRVSSLVITCFAASEILLLFIGIAIQAVFDSVQDTIDFLTNIVVGVVVSLYVAARVALLVLALIELRALPPGAYETVYWTAFIPHI